MRTPTDSHKNLFVGKLSIILALIVTFGVPALYAGLSFENHRISLQTEAKVIAEDISRFITTKSASWPPVAHRLNVLLENHSLLYEHSAPKRIVDLDEKVYFDDNISLPFPVFEKEAFLYDGQNPVGKVIVQGTLNGLFKGTLLFLLLGIVLGILVYYNVHIPLHELQTTLKALHDQKERLTTTLTSIADGVIATDASGNITIFNGQAESITEYPASDVIGKDFDVFFNALSDQPDEKRKNLVQRALWQKEMVTVFEDTLLKSKSAKRKDISITGSPIISKNGEKIGAIFILRDITEQKKTEEELRKVEQLDTLGFFAGGLAHDFNNILTTINNNVSRVLHASETSSTHLETLAGVCEAVQHAKKLTTQLLTFAKGGNPTLEVLAPKNLLKSTIQYILRGSEIQVSYDLPDSLWNVKADEGQLAQVVQNLVINAIQAMEGHGTLSIRGKNIKISEDDNGIHNGQGKWVEIAFQDTGPGIRSGITKNIFTPYFTTKPNGSGLGLAVCYSIAKKHNGTITFESSEGKGTTFYFRIPASFDSPSERETQAQKPLKGLGKILVMDDDLPLLESVGNTLRDLGYQVTMTRHGDEAVRVYKEASRTGRPFDLVILDLTVPGKMGGKETVQQIREFDPAVKAIVSSGYSDDQVVSHYKRYGFCGILNKPYQTYQLSKIVRETISSVLPDFSGDTLRCKATATKNTNAAPLATVEGQKNTISSASLLLQPDDGTYTTCKAELSSGVLHAIRNTLTPVFLDVQRLKENLQEIDLSSYDTIVNEFAKPDLAEERKTKLIRFLTLTHELLEQKLDAVLQASDLVSTSVLRIGKMLEKRDGYLNKDQESFSLPDLVQDAISLLQESAFQQVSFQLDRNMEDISRIQGNRLLLMLIVHKIMKNCVESINQSKKDGGAIQVHAHILENQSEKRLAISIQDTGLPLDTAALTYVNEPTPAPPRSARDRDLHFCATSMALVEGALSVDHKKDTQGNKYTLTIPFRENHT